MRGGDEEGEGRSQPSDSRSEVRKGHPECARRRVEDMGGLEREAVLVVVVVVGFDSVCETVLQGFGEQGEVGGGRRRHCHLRPLGQSDLRKKLEAVGGCTVLGTEDAELEALIEGLDKALALDLKRVTFFCENYMVFQYV